MVSFGSKALPLRRFKDLSISDNNQVCEDGGIVYRGKHKGMGRKGNKNQSTSEGGHQSTGTAYNQTVKDERSFQKRDYSEPAGSFVRKQIDPETAKYFLEITNVLEGGEVDSDERTVICINALEETTGKEVELANDYVISHTIQTLLDGCGADHLCGFLRSSAKSFAQIATDRCGSHVAETALNSLATHLLDETFYNLIKDTLTLICQSIVEKPVDVMCNCHGSHVLRSLLCLCRGVPLDSEFHTSKSSTSLAKRLNLRSERERNKDTPNAHEGFPDLLEFLVSEMLKCSRADIATLQVDQYSSLVLQTALKVLAGQEQVLLRVIPVILGCNVENTEDGFIELAAVGNIKEIVKENAFSHLIEVILEVAPDTLYDEIFTKIFKGSLFEVSKHYSANFTVQALISHARNQTQVDAVGEELGPKIKELLELGKSGVVASLIATSQRLHAFEHKCSKALAAAVSATANEPPKCIVPRLLLLDSYLSSNDKSNWSWASGFKINVMGSLILQSLFKYPCEYIQPYTVSITSMENSQVLETAKDNAGARVIEAFLSSSAADKQKKKLLSKLKGHFGELAMHPSGSFTVEKCFNAGDVTIREAVVSELAAVQKELSQTRQSFLLRNLDVEGYSRRPEQWVSRQKAKLSFYKDFLAEPAERAETETKSSKRKNPPVENSKKAAQQANINAERAEIEAKSSKRKNPPVENSKKAAQQANIKNMRQEIDTALTSSLAPEVSKKHKKQKKEGKNHGDEKVEREQLSDKKKRKHQKEDSSKPSKKSKT